MALKLNGITKSFDNKLLFKDLSYEFHETGIVAITGVSGVGKTTLLRIIAGLDHDYAGRVEGGGIGQVSIAFQEYRLFPQLTAYENAICSINKRKVEADDYKAREILLKLGINSTDFDLYPDELSGGMKQRISLCRAFLADTPILILDEPTKELDRENVNSVMEIIRQESSKRLVIIVSHSQDDIEALSAEILPIANF